MTSRLSALTVDCADPQLLADFWCAVLGWREVEADHDGISIAGDDPAVPGIDVLRVPEGKTVKNRLHLDLRGLDGDPERTIEELAARGATVLHRGTQGPAAWATLTDPEGNEFCVPTR